MANKRWACALYAEVLEADQAKGASTQTEDDQDIEIVYEDHPDVKTALAWAIEKNKEIHPKPKWGNYYTAVREVSVADQQLKPLTEDAKTAHVTAVVSEWLNIFLVNPTDVCTGWLFWPDKDKPALLFRLFYEDSEAMRKCREEIATDDEVKKLAEPTIKRLFTERQAAVV